MTGSTRAQGTTLQSYPINQYNFCKTVQCIGHLGSVLQKMVTRKSRCKTWPRCLVLNPFHNTHWQNCSSARHRDAGTICIVTISCKNISYLRCLFLTKLSFTSSNLRFFACVPPVLFHTIKNIIFYSSVSGECWWLALQYLVPFIENVNPSFLQGFFSQGC